MNIRAKIVLVVLPLIIAPLVLTGVISTLSARNGITALATSFLQFKAEQLVTYAQGQWNLLNANGLESTPAYLDASKAAVESFAKSLVRSPTENIFAVAADGTIAMRSGDLSASPAELEALQQMARAHAAGWRTLRVGGEDRIAHLAEFTPFQWTFFVTESASAFYQSADAIVRQAAYILAASLAASVFLLLFFAGILTRPLRQVADAMTEIISTRDLSRRVEVLYKDETGRLGHTFNLMSEELGKAYDQIKGYALHAAVAETRERKIRNVFQRYVPKTVIDQFLANPEGALVGEKRIVAVLFSDIRDFTTISESMQPDELVESLNRYFTGMVEIIMDGKGTVDKYIGDAIMAVFGAPERLENDALASLRAALDMVDALPAFNEWQVGQGRAPFRTGIGIHYGEVTVGNIGSERKMDYTVIGDTVNLASRLESLTKKYQVPLVVSDTLFEKVPDAARFRRLDKVSVKGRSGSTVLYEARRALAAAEEKAWRVHEQALDLYYERRFVMAERAFQQELSFTPHDQCTVMFLERCALYAHIPPSPAWEGVEEMTEK